MARFGMGGGRARGDEAVPGPDVVAPRRSLDGWTLEGTALGGRFAGEELRELGTLMHGVSAGMDTPWTYERAADILEAGGERPQALAVLDAYFALPRRIHDANPVSTRALARRRQRLRKRLGVRVPDAVVPATDAADAVDGEAEVPTSRVGEVQALDDVDVAAFAKAADAGRKPGPAGTPSGSRNGAGTGGASTAAEKTGAASGRTPGAGASAASSGQPAGPSAARRGLAAAKRKSKAVGRVIAAKAAAAGTNAGPATPPADTPQGRPGGEPPAVVPPRPEAPPPPIDGTAPIPRKPEKPTADIAIPPKPTAPPPATADSADLDSSEAP